jgi:hypothetical protein
LAYGMARMLIASVMLVALAGCAALRGPPAQSFFVVFFVPGTTQLAPEAQQIVRQAAAGARTQKVSKIQVAVPPDTPGGVQLVEGRFTAIENILSASGVDAKLYARTPLMTAGPNVPGAVNRAEIRLVR